MTEYRAPEAAPSPEKWPNKRLMLTYWLLWMAFKDREFNIGEAIDLLKPFISTRAAVKSVKKLANLKWIERRGVLRYAVINPEKVYPVIALKYFHSRAKRRGTLEHAVRVLKNLGLSIEGSEDHGS